MKRVLLLCHAWECPEAFVGTILDEYAIARDLVNVERGRPLPVINRYAAIIALGGPQHVYQKELYPYLIAEEKLIREAVEQEIPFLGICLGGQLLASALGGAVRPHTTAEVGFFDVPLTTTGRQDPLFEGLPGYQKVFHWHQDTFDPPQNAQLLASNRYTTNQAFRFGERAYGLQYHIELDIPMLDTWLYHPVCKEELLNAISPEEYKAIEADRAEFFTTYQAHSRLQLTNFLRLGALIGG
jgi:GMP synthase-like glutamine amidotransferase